MFFSLTEVYAQLSYANGILSIKDIFDCLTSEVRSYNQLGLQLISMNPDKYNEILTYYNSYTLADDELETFFDKIYGGLVLSNNEYYTGNNILMENITTINNSNLTVDARNIIIKKTFTISGGCGLSLNILEN